MNMIVMVVIAIKVEEVTSSFRDSACGYFMRSSTILV